MAENHETYREIERKVLNARIEPRFSVSDPEALRRVPRGFPADHPAADLLRATRWGVHLTMPAEAALKPGFGKNVVSMFRTASPLVLALAESMRPTVKGAGKHVDPLFSHS